MNKLQYGTNGLILWCLLNLCITPIEILGFSRSIVSHHQIKVPTAHFSWPVASSGRGDIDIVWERIRNDAFQESAKEPLLASFMHSTVLSHPSLESSISFHLANLLSSASMINTQIQALILECTKLDPNFSVSIRKDILAVVTRDPAVKAYTDVLLYFKGFHALQTHRVAHWLWKNERTSLALFLHSRSNAMFQVSIHPGATIGTGVLIDHGTGVVIGETAVVGDDVSMLHKVTLSGTGTGAVHRHPRIERHAILGAGSTIIGPVTVGERANVGACSMVIGDIPSYAVAVGVPAKVISRRDPSFQLDGHSTEGSFGRNNNLLSYDI